MDRWLRRPGPLRILYASPWRATARDLAQAERQPQLPQHQPHEHQTAGVDERRPEPVRAADARLHVRSRAVAQNRELLSKGSNAHLAPWQRLLQALQPELGTLEARQELLMPLLEDRRSLLQLSAPLGHACREVALVLRHKPRNVHHVLRLGPNTPQRSPRPEPGYRHPVLLPRDVHDKAVEQNDGVGLGPGSDLT